MATLTVGQDGSEQFSTIESAVQAASPGDTIDINAGTYVDDFLTIEQSLTLQAVGGPVVMTEDTSPPDGKAMITEGQPGLDITINGFDISGVSVGDQNGAAIRYEGGNLTLGQDYFHDNQEGLLGADDPNGTITIDDSEFARNGNGSGFTHNIYVGNIATLTVENSFIHDSVVGHDIKSRAENTVIQNNTISDLNGSGSYEIDVPNGGNLTVTGNVIEKGPNAQNPNVIAYGEEGASNPGTSVDIANNTLVNDNGSRVQAFWDAAGVPATFDSNTVWNLTAGQLPADATNTIFAGTRPAVNTTQLSFMYPAEGGNGSGSGSGNSGGTGGSGGTGNSGDGGSTGGAPPPPTLPLIDTATWQAEVWGDFSNYAAANPQVWSDPAAIGAVVSEYNDPLTGSAGIPSNAVWGPFPS